MRKLLLQLDSSRLASVFDRVVAYDGGADAVLGYGGITATDVRDLVYGCMFTRGPKDLNHTAVFIGGSDIAAGEQLLAAATHTMFKPFTVSVMLDSNGSIPPPSRRSRRCSRPGPTCAASGWSWWRGRGRSASGRPGCSRRRARTW